MNGRSINAALHVGVGLLSLWTAPHWLHASAIPGLLFLIGFNAYRAGLPK